MENIVQGQWFSNAGDSGFPIEQSLRFNSGTAQQLLHTNFLAGNARPTTYTLSFWIKSQPGQDRHVAVGHSSGASYRLGTFYADDNIGTQTHGGTVTDFSTAVFRDPSAWYHVVLRSLSDTVTCYVNGQLVGSHAFNAFLSDATPDWIIGRPDTSTGTSADMYLAEYHFVDGTGLEPTSFGRYNDSGVWIPSKYTGSYGTLGFYLTFDSSQSPNGVGTDSSGNGKHFTASSFDTTAISASNIDNDIDYKDTPTSNHATLNPQAVSNPAETKTYEKGMLGMIAPNMPMFTSTVAMPDGTGIYYWEVANGSATGGIGVCSVESQLRDFDIVDDNTLITDNGTVVVNGTLTASAWNNGSFGNGLNQIYGCQYDSNTRRVRFYVTGSDPTYTGITTVGTNEIEVPASWGDVYAVGLAAAAAGNVSVNFGQHAFIHQPAGTVAVQTRNLPDPSIKDGSLHFQAVLGQGSGTETAVDSGELGGDFTQYLFTDNTDTASPNYASTDQANFLGVAGQAFNGNLSNAAVSPATAKNWLIFRPATPITVNSSLRVRTDQFISASVNQADVGLSDVTNGSGTLDWETIPVTTPLSLSNLAIRGGSSSSTDTPGTIQSFYDTVGTDTWTCPDGVTQVSVTMIAGGGGGGGGGTLGSGGGGGGGYYVSETVNVTPFQTYNLTIGNGGNGSGGSGNGSGGTSTLFDSLLTCTGGGGGRGNNNTIVAAGGTPNGNPGQVGSYNSYHAAGGAGISCVVAGVTKYGGYGGAGRKGTSNNNNGGAGMKGFILIEYVTQINCAKIAAIEVDGKVLVDAGILPLAQQAFSDGMYWIKGRDTADQHQFLDTLNGTSTMMRHPSAIAESTYVEPGGTAVAYCWKADDAGPITYNVKVVNDSGNKYRFDDHGTSAVTLELMEGRTYVFDQSDASNSGHPLRFSGGADGVHGGFSEYTNGVTVEGTPGSAGAKTTFTVPAGLGTLYYYCSNHGGMGGSINTPTRGSSNLKGTIPSKIQTNVAGGFSILRYTGTGAAATVGHGLSAAPEFVMATNRTDGGGWSVWHSGMEADDVMFLQTNGGATDLAYFNDTAPTSDVISLGVDNDTNELDKVHTIYCWHGVEGYSKFGTFVGNGVAAGGAFVYTGFKPALVITKSIYSAAGAALSGHWLNHDSARVQFNPVNISQYPNLTNVEVTSQSMDFYSNGFKYRSASNSNANTGVYAYFAWAENPFGGKYTAPATAR